MIEFLKNLFGESDLDQLVRLGLKLGEGCSIQAEVFLDPSHCWHIEIGNRVTLAPRVHVLAHDASLNRVLGFTRVQRVVIGDDVFVGAGAIVLPGSRIGPRTIIGAGSVVSGDVPEAVVAAGNPCRVICTLDAFVAKHRERMREAPRFGRAYSLGAGITAEMRAEMVARMGDGPGYLTDRESPDLPKE